ncbi:hypothetical protein EVAR_19235_1 [Eumeta japonica]|uniref:Uncharacterized protein n=1 Tax=Eumeta variegata TaxID=151549 RepID=A0A4C1VE49_EUMVA|nr:hypothetical protein EVAR_19235_1 [Eumeta japonica]
MWESGVMEEKVGHQNSHSPNEMQQRKMLLHVGILYLGDDGRAPTTIIPREITRLAAAPRGIGESREKENRLNYPTAEVYAPYKPSTAGPLRVGPMTPSSPSI